jgi:hypothetical protein
MTGAFLAAATAENLWVLCEILMHSQTGREEIAPAQVAGPINAWNMRRDSMAEVASDGVMQTKSLIARRG